MLLLNPTLRDARKQCRVAAEQTGDRAFMYVQLGSKVVEVRVWPDGRTTLTKV